jgi:prepilin-type N-terminal cleavage/methylation domain-containing protein
MPSCSPPVLARRRRLPAVSPGRRPRGFNLIEVLVVVLIVAPQAGISI